MAAAARPGRSGVARPAIVRAPPGQRPAEGRKRATRIHPSATLAGIVTPDQSDRRGLADVGRVRHAYRRTDRHVHPHGADPSVFLFDIDASGFTTLTNAGAYEDLPQAAAAWRTLVGDTAEGTAPVEVRTGEQLSCLACCDTGDEITGDETRNRLDNWFRANRCVHDLAHALRKSRCCGRPLYRCTRTWTPNR
jgi:hypothetical protein